MSAKSTITPEQAFVVFYQMGPKRSINALTDILRGQGHSVARSTLIAWEKKHGWKDKVSSELSAEAAATAQAAALIAEKRMERSDEERAEMLVESASIEDVLAYLHALAATLAKTATQHVAAMNVFDGAMEPSAVVTLVRAAGDLAGAVGNLHKALNPPAPKGAAAARDEGGALPGAGFDPVAASYDDIIKGLQNPPRMQRSG